jgi:hypothetical protein
MAIFKIYKEKKLISPFHVVACRQFVVIFGYLKKKKFLGEFFFSKKREFVTKYSFFTKYFPQNGEN